MMTQEQLPWGFHVAFPHATQAADPDLGNACINFSSLGGSQLVKVMFSPSTTQVSSESRWKYTDEGSGEQ